MYTPEPIQLPRDILDRVDRVQDYHRLSQVTYDSVRATPPVLDWENQPSVYRLFTSAPKVELPTRLMDAPAGALPLLASGISSLEEEQLRPPQDLRTLATWLYLAAGRTVEKQAGDDRYWLRTCPSSGALYPCELYVAAFAVAGLEPGLYHFSVKEFALRKLREGAETLSQIKRGRPDLEFLKSVPAAILVSTVFWRSAWKYQLRSYRIAALDAGHCLQSLVTTGTGLGIQTIARLRLNDKTTRELIGIPPDAPFGSAEAVQGMVVWADVATLPMPPPPRGVVAPPLQPIEREPLSAEFVPYGSVLAVHQDCVAPGVAVREIRPPVSNNSAMPPEELGVEFAPSIDTTELKSLRAAILSRRSSRDFVRAAIPRQHVVEINRLALQGSSYYPILPDGSHVGLVRPFWVINDVTGMDTGLWHYHPPADRWWLVRRGDFRIESRYLSVEQPLCGNASAVCFLTADLRYLMLNAGPDAYRLAHLEAGLVGQRIQLACAALGLGCCGIGSFYDEEVRTFLGLSQSGYEPIYEIAIGVDAPAEGPEQLPALEAGWRGDWG